MTTIEQETREASQARQFQSGELIYRFEGQLGGMYPVGVFPEGMCYHNEFEGTVVDGPFAGGRIFGLDQFMLRPDGVGVIIAPEIIDTGAERISIDLRGYVVPPEGVEFPPLEVIASPDFVMPPLECRVTGAGMVRTTAEGYERLNSVVAVVEGTVNLGTGKLSVEARAA